MAKKDLKRLQVSEDMPFQRLEWRIERIGWVAMAMLIVAALLGLLSNGPLSRANQSAGSLHVEYQRFLRNQAPADFRVEVLSAKGEVEISLNRGFVDDVQLEQVVPRPNRIDAGPKGIVLHFDVPQNSAPNFVIIRFQPQRMGWLRTNIGSPGQPIVRLTQFVYP